jgi:hypothetical protein
VHAKWERAAPPLARIGPTAAHSFHVSELHVLSYRGPYPCSTWCPPVSVGASAPPQPSARDPATRDPRSRGAWQGRSYRGTTCRLVWSTRVLVGVHPAVGHGVRVKGEEEVRHVKPPSTPRAWPCKAGSHPYAGCQDGLDQGAPALSFTSPTKGST